MTDLLAYACVAGGGVLVALTLVLTRRLTRPRGATWQTVARNYKPPRRQRFDQWDR